MRKIDFISGSRAKRKLEEEEKLKALLVEWPPVDSPFSYDDLLFWGSRLGWSVGRVQSTLKRIAKKDAKNDNS